MWLHDFARFHDAEAVLAKAFVDYNGAGSALRWAMLRPTSLSASWMVGINGRQIHSEKSAESGIKNRDPDHYVLVFYLIVVYFLNVRQRQSDAFFTFYLRLVVTYTEDPDMLHISNKVRRGKNLFGGGNGVCQFYL